MNKDKSGAKPVVPINLSSKKAGCSKPETLFTPYKIEWKNVDLQTSHKKNSTFFNSMKTELSNYKEHIDKMIKDSTPNLSPRASNKIKSIEVSKQVDKKVLCEITPINQKNQISHQSLNDSCGQNRKQNIPKIIISHENSKTKKDKIKSFQTSQKKTPSHEGYSPLRIKELVFEEDQKQVLKKQLSIQAKSINTLKREKDELMKENKEKDGLVTILKEQIQVLREANIKKGMEESILKEEKVLSEINHENEDLKEHNNILEDKIEALCEKVSLMEEEYERKQKLIEHQQKMIAELQNKIVKLNEQRLQNRKYQELMEQSEQKINNMREQLKITNQLALQGIKKQFETEMREKEEEYEKKLQKVEEDHVTEINYYIGELKSKYEMEIQSIQDQNATVKGKNEQIIKNLEQELQTVIAQLLQSKDKALIEKEEGSKVEEINFAKLGVEFEYKINILIDENYELKNKVSQLEVYMVKFQQEKKNYEEEIRILQEREQYRQIHRNQEVGKICQQLANLKIEKKQIVEEYEYKVMKLQNQLQKSRTINELDSSAKVNGMVSSYSSKNINKVLKEQLQQNQELKEKIRGLSDQVNRLKDNFNQQISKNQFLRQNIELQKVKNSVLEQNMSTQEGSCKQLSDNNPNPNKPLGKECLQEKIENLLKNQEKLNFLLETRNKQIKVKDDFIQKVLVSKKDSEEEQVTLEAILGKINDMAK